MTKSLNKAWLLVVLATTFGGNCVLPTFDDGGISGNKDSGTVVTGDLAGQPDLTGLTALTTRWTLKTCKGAIVGCATMMGFNQTCAEAKITNLKFTVTNTLTGKVMSTQIPCPPGVFEGDASFAMPDPETIGPWTVVVTSDDKPGVTQSEIYCNITKGCFAFPRAINFFVYGGGCDDPECKACNEQAHTLPWCE